MKIKGVTLHWLGHSGVQLMWNEDNYLYIDPYEIGRGRPDAKYLFITHNHYDHLSIEDIDSICTEETIIIAPTNCHEKLADLPGELHLVKPGEEHTFGEINIEVIPAYNKKKDFHTQEEEWVGYIIEIDGTRIYHAGDTDNIPEMKGITADVALLPISGTYVMNAEEAAEATKKLNIKTAVPIHWGSFIGEISDAEQFKKLATCKVTILEKEH